MELFPEPARLAVGVTGTQDGGTERQYYLLQQMLGKEFKSATELTFHHGDCIGVDAKADSLAYAFGFKITIYPCTINEKRAFTRNYTHAMPPKLPLDRNRDIVDAVDVLYVLPSSMQEQLRSGTWATYRYCKKIGKPYVIIYPDGTVFDSRTDAG